MNIVQNACYPRETFVSGLHTVIWRHVTTQDSYCIVFSVLLKFQLFKEWHDAEFLRHSIAVHYGRQSKTGVSVL